MIQIPLIADVYFPRGETPVLEFQDVREAEQFLLYLQKRIDAKRARKKQRLEYYSDGIYLDGKRLDIRGLAELFLLQFEYVDIVSEYDLARNVWGDTLASREAIYQVCDRIRRKTGIWIERDGVMYKIHRPN